MINNLYFHIHYCNGNKLIEIGKFSSGIVRTLQHHELMYICNGSGSCIVNGRRYSIKSGLLLYIAPDVPFSIELDTKVPAGCLTVHFSYTRVSFNDGKWAVQDETQNLSSHPAQELKDAYLVEEQFQKLLDCWNEKLPGYEFKSGTILQQLLLTIGENLNKHSQNFAASLKVEKIIQYMHQNLNGKITLAELAKFVQITPFYMARTFKAATGYTIIEYFNKLKIDKSKELLIEGNKKVKEVAQELGFADEFYFSRMFKKAEGINPSEFCSKIVHDY
jgi:AraC family transcriptional regulator, transcriptional activator for feuABC-ybbA operon